MKLFKCLISGDELFTDAFKYEEKNGFYRVAGKTVSVSNKIDESKLGANASAEEANEDAEDGDTSGIDVVIYNKLEPTSAFPSAKEYKKYFKDFVKELKDAILEKNPGQDMKAFQSSIQAAFTYACEWIKDADCYIGQSHGGTIVLCHWEVLPGETDDKPFFYFYKDALKEEKL